jgi:tetratricopeptide (TPR) repeat protein
LARACLRKYDEALDDYTALLRLDPRNTRALRERAAVYDKKGETAKAQADREKAFQIDPSLREAPPYRLPVDR